MISLVVTICMIGQPGVCKDITNSYNTPGLTVHYCQMNAQPELAKLIGEHPNWKIERWKCVDASKKKIDI